MLSTASAIETPAGTQSQGISCMIAADWADRWVHVRPSNTEPIVRVIAEAPQAGAAAGLCKEVGAMLG